MATTKVYSALGLSDVYYQTQTSDAATQATPVYDATAYRLEGAVTLNFNSAAALATQYADDMPFSVMESIGEMGITASFAGLLPADEARLLGHTYANGVITKKATDTSPWVTIAGKTLLDGGVYGYVRYYKVKFSKPNSEDQTKEASPAPRTITLEGRVAALSSTTYSGTYLQKARSDDTDLAAGYLTTFLSAVQYPGTDLGALSAAIANSSGKIRYTFTKVGGGNITLSTSQLIAANLPIMSEATGVQEAGAYAITSGNGTATVVVDFTPTVAFSAEDVACGIVGNTVFDQNGVGCGAKFVVITYP